MKRFEPQILKYIENIDDLLDCLDLTVEDKKNIHNHVMDLYHGVLQVNHDSYGTSPFEDLKGWIEFSIEILGEYEEYHSALRSLEKLLYMCPDGLYLKRQV